MKKTEKIEIAKSTINDMLIALDELGVDVIEYLQEEIKEWEKCKSA